MAAELNRREHACSVGLVAELMREAGLKVCQPRAHKTTTVPGERPAASPDPLPDQQPKNLSKILDTPQINYGHRLAEVGQRRHRQLEAEVAFGHEVDHVAGRCRRASIG